MRGEEVVEIRIPAGVGEGMVLTVAGKGNAARQGGVNGDLLVVIDEERNPELVRDGNDLSTTSILPFRRHCSAVRWRFLRSTAV